MEKAASLILNKLALRNNILDILVSDTNDLKSKTRNIEDHLDDLEQYSRKLCLKFSGNPENTDEDTDTLIFNTVNNFLVPLNTTNSINLLFATPIAWIHHVVMVKPKIIVRFGRYRDRASVYKQKES